MRNDDNYYGYNNDYDSGMLYLMEQPALRPISDTLVLLKHALLMLGGKLLQWILAMVLILASIMAIGFVLTLGLEALGIAEAFSQREMWWLVVGLIIVLFINMLPLVFSAGFVSIAAGVAEEGEFVFSRLFAGFGEQVGQLVKLLLFWLLASFALCMLLGIAKLGNSPWVLLPVAVMFLLCNWMVLPLIMLQGVSPLDAIWMSLVGSLKNILPQGGFVLAMLAVLLGVSFLAVDGLRLLAQGGSWVSLLLLLVFYTVLCTVFPIIGYVSYRNIWTSAPLE